MTTRLHFLSFVFFCFANMALAFLPPADPPLPDYDKRVGTASGLEVVSRAQRLAVERLRLRQPHIQVEFDRITSSPKSVLARDAFLSGSHGLGGAIPVEAASRFAVDDPHRATKAFLLEYRDLFGHGPEALDEARVRQQFVTPHNGLRTVVWQQQVDGIPVFEAVLISHISSRGELVNLSSRFLPGATTALKRAGQNRADRGVSLQVSARRALAIAAGQVGEQLLDEQIEVGNVSNPGPLVLDPEKRQKFRAPVLKGEAEARVVWLPMNPEQIRLCWDIILTGRKRGEMFRVLVDVRTGEPLLRRCLTEYISDATYRVFTSDSPSPFSPGFSTPTSDQPPLISRSLLTMSALDTNASPNGWIDDGVNETLGNNVDAHTDLNADNQPDLPRPHGSPFRVFDFPLDLGNNPSTYRDAAVVQLFYWCNWMHDQLYGLGFTEEAGNFQSDNFGRGGLGNDAVQADAQDGSGVNNSNFSTPPDGSPGRMQMYVFTGPSPARDGDLDAEIILHEYTHGLSNRRVGGGVGMVAQQSRGMGEGWSDFYALSLLSQPDDDVDGVYAIAAYAAYQLSGLTQNYYFGIRRYPYCTDLNKNPLTFKDIDPFQASSHVEIPRNPVIFPTADEVHNMGEVWCGTLWEARANLIRKYGWAAGNRLILQLVTDGMTLSPPNPNYLQARDGILQAELLDSGGANQNELWHAFAKRGMGWYATSPDSSMATGVHESFDLPDDLRISSFPAGLFSFQSGRVQVPACQTCLLSNAGSNMVNWTAFTTEPWVSVDPASGSISPGTSNAVSICLTAAANLLPSTNYTATISISNTASGITLTLSVMLQLSPPEVSFFSLDAQPAWPYEGEWEFGKPAGLGGTENGYPDPSTAASGTNVFGVNLNGDYSLEIGGPYFLTAGPFDFSGYTGMSLHFLRWLNSDFQPYVYDTIEVSADGTNWNPLWDNGTSAIADEAWAPESYDISAWADNQTNVYVRWGYRVASTLAFTYSGWNIDDVGFAGNPSQQLTINVPLVVNVGAGILTGTVLASPVPTHDLTVALISSDAATVAVPAFVTIPAGQSNAVFNLTVAGQLHGRGMETVMIGAVAPNYVAGSTNIQVLDNAAVSLYLSLPGTASESQGTLEGEVFIRDVQTNTLLVQLSSSNTTVLRVPDSILIPVGQTTAVFAATLVYNNLLIDGPQVAMVSAHAPGWLDATGSVVIGLPAVIVQQPTNLAVAVGGEAAMGVAAAGTAPLSYQWSVGGTNLADATNSVLVLTNVQLSNAGSYAVKVSNAFGSEQSSNAVLSVGVPPAFVVEPVSQTVRLGSSAAFDVIATGTAPLAYQWSLGGTNLAAATNSVLTLTNLQRSDGGSYAVVVSNAFGLASSTNAVLTIVLPAVIVQQPTNLAVAVGGEAAMGVVAAGAAPLSYQWSVGGTNLVGATNSMLVLTNVQLSDAGSYAVEVSNAFGSEQSSNAVLSVGVPPVIVVEPESQTVRLGAAAAFEVAATGTASLAYQWSLGGTNLAGATNNVLLLTNLQWRDGGSYAVVVSNAFGMASSTSAVLTIWLAAVIVQQPTNVAVAVGGEAVMGVVAQGTAPLSYQWSLGGTNLVDATNSVLVLTNVQLSQAGSYSVEVSNAFGSERSSNAVLSVGLAPAIVVQPASQRVRLGGSAAFDVTAAGTPPLGYKWTLGGTNLAGATNSVLVLTNLQWSDGGSYAVVVSNAFGMASSTNAVLTIGLPAVIVQQPTNLAVAVGGQAAMGVVAEGTAPLSYQWSRGRTNLVDATNSVLVLTNVQLSDTGSYAVEVANAFGSEQSSNAVLSVGVPPAIVVEPMSQKVRLGGSTAFEVSASGTAPLAYQWTLGGTDLAGATNSVLVLTNVQWSDGGSYAVSVSSAFGMASSTNAVLTVGLAALIVQQPANLAVAVGGEAAMGVVAAGTAPLSYQWSMGGTNLVDATNSVLVLTNVQLSDTGSYAVEVANAFGSEQSSNAVLSVGVPPAIVTQPVGQTVRLGGSATFEVTATGTAPLAYQWTLGGTNLAAGTNSVLVLTNLQWRDGGSYAVMVSNAFGMTSSTNALLTIVLPAVIVQQPTNLAVAVGGEAAMGVVAEGTAPLSYQWSLGGTNLVYATNSVLVLTNVQLSDAGNYAVVVANAFGSEQSSNAVLSVGVPPAIVVEPMSQKVRLGGSATFGVSASGTAPLAYQWSLGGTDLAGATNSVLVLTNVQWSDGGSYAVVVSNAFGLASSINAVLTVGLPAVIVQQPTNLAVALGGEATMGIVAAGTEPLSYQWILGGTNLVDATNSVLVLTNVQLRDTGTYAVEVSNAFGSEQSSNAVLSVGMAPAIVVEPVSQTVRLGGSTTFGVSATGTAPLAYQWTLGGASLAAATHSVLVLTNVQVRDGGSYAVVVSNAFGLASSTNAVLTVGLPAVVVQQPTNLSVAVGGVAAMGIVAQGTAPLSYQWSLGGTNLVGATNSVLVLTNVQMSDAGSYAVVVSNAFGSGQSSNAVLSVGLPPTLVVQPESQTVRLGAAAAFEVAATGTAPLAYQWSLGGTNLAAGTNNVLVLNNVQWSQGGSYAVVVSNAFGMASSTNAVLTIWLATLIVQQPTNLVVAVGGDAVMSVVAEGTAPLSYQWSRGGTNLLGATNSVLVLTNVHLSDAGTYAVLVSNALGSEQSANAVLTVGLAPAIVVQPVSQTVRLGGSATFVLAAAGAAPLAYQWSLGGTNLAGATNSVLVVTNVQRSDGGSYSAVVSNAFGTASSTNAVLTVGLPAVIVQQPTNLAVVVGREAVMGTMAEGMAPLSYQWSLGGTNLPGATNSVLVLTNVQVSDAGSYAVGVSNAFGSEQSSNAVLRVGLAPAIVAEPVSQAIRLGGSAAFQVTATGTAPLAYQWTLGSTNLGGATNSLLLLTNVQRSDAGGYVVIVSNTFGIASSTNAVLTVGLPPVVVQQPTNLAVAVGGVAAMGIVADGTAPLSYKWSLGGTNLLNATNSILVLTNVQLSDAGNYAVEVANAFGSEQSSNAVLSVGLTPAIQVQPADRAALLGGLAAFEATASGTAPLAFQWSLGGTNLAGATSSVLVLTNLQWSDGGSYAVVVSNAFGIVSSTNAVLTIWMPAVIVQQPTNLAVAVGGVAAMGVVAEGTAPLSYQWSVGGTNRVDATNSVLVLTNVQLSDAGSYAVKVSNAFGSVQSSNALLSVGLPPAIVVEPVSRTVRRGGSATFEVTAAGTGPLAYQWTLGGTKLAAGTNSVLVLTNVQWSDGGSYAVVVSNAFGLASSSNAVLTIELPAVIVQQPTNVAVAVGGVAAMGIVAEGTAPLSYQWSLGGTNLVGATNSVLVLTNVQLSDAGSYAVEVANAFGSEQSSNAVLSVGVPPSIVIQPVSQTVRLGGSATFEVAAAGTEPLTYQWSLGTTNLAAATNSVLVITNVQRRDVGSYTVVVSNAFGVASSSNATLLVYAVDHFTWDPIPSPRFLNVPFSVRIQALDATNGLITGFTGRVALRSTAGVSVNPSTSGDFVQGEWTGSMTVAQAATNAILVAADDSGDLGYANPIDVVSIPSLSIDPSGSSVLLSWPAGVPAFVLETTSDFASWSQVTTPIGLTGDKYEVRLRTSGTKAFYRLRFVPPTGGQ